MRGFLAFLLSCDLIGESLIRNRCLTKNDIVPRTKEAILEDLYCAREALQEARAKTRKARADSVGFKSKDGYVHAGNHFEITIDKTIESCLRDEQRLRDFVASCEKELLAVLTTPEYLEKHEGDQDISR